MVFVLTKIIQLNPEEIEHLHIPYICDTEDIIRLKRIVYAALSYLHARSEDEILTAWEDTINLYNWFFETQKEEVRQEIQNQLQSDPSTLPPYMDIEEYIENSVNALELAYLSEVDVLNAILNSPHIKSLNEIECVKSNFSPTEFFCVLALYQAALSINALTHTRELLDHSKIITPEMMQGLKDATNATLEAQIAISYAQNYAEISSQRLSDFINDWVKNRRQWLTQKAHQGRYGENYQKRHQKAWELYQKLRPSHSSDYNTAAAMVEEIEIYSDQHGLEPLKKDSAVDTIYKWIQRMKKKHAK